MRVSGWSLYLSGCPGSHDNDKREDSSGGRLWLGVAECLESRFIARAATEESYGSSPGSSSGVSWHLVALRSLTPPLALVYL